MINLSAINLKKGDKVEVITGKDRGKKGKILKVLPEKEKVIIEGINLIKRHTKPTQKSPQGGIVEKEAALNVSNMMLVCPSCGHKTRIGKRLNSDGLKVRFCKKCDQAIDKA